MESLYLRSEFKYFTHSFREQSGKLLSLVFAVFKAFNYSRDTKFTWFETHAIFCQATRGSNWERVRITLRIPCTLKAAATIEVLSFNSRFRRLANQLRFQKIDQCVIEDVNCRIHVCLVKTLAVICSVEVPASLSTSSASLN